MDKITAIVSSYKSGDNLRGCIEDLLAQTLVPEIIVIANDPTGEELQTLEDYKGKIIFEVVPRESLYASWNRAIDLATGEYITCANTDDRHTQDYMQKMSEALDGGLDYVYADQHLDNSVGEFGELISGWLEFNKESLSYACYSGCQPMWRKSLHEKYGYFDQSYEVAGDWEWMLRVADERVSKIPELLGSHYLNPDGLSNSPLLKDIQLEEIGRIRTKYIPIYRKTTISVAMIVKNEQEYIYDCLDSVKGFADEIVICDTGSTDNTLKEIERFKEETSFDKILLNTIEWEDDFAKARNEALKRCTKKWILSIDADERVVNPTTVRASAMSFQNVDGVYVTIDSPLNESVKVSPYVKACRFFKNGAEFRGKAHETVDRSILVNHGKILDSPIKFLHLGYSKDADTNNGKALRNLKILEEQVKETPDDAYGVYQLGMTHYITDSKDLGHKYFVEALELGLSDPIAATVHYCRAKDSAIESDYDKAVEHLMTCLSLAPRQSQGRMLLGKIYTVQGEFSKAIEQFSIVADRETVPLDQRVTDVAYDGRYDLTLIEQSINFCKSKLKDKCQTSQEM